MDTDTIDTLFTAAETVATELGASPLVTIGLHAAEGLIGELRRESDGSIRLVQAQEQAAGASANKAAHLAELRWAIARHVSNYHQTIEPESTLVNAIMAEVARRMP